MAQRQAASRASGVFTRRVTGDWIPALAGCEGAGSRVLAASTTGDFTGALGAFGRV